ncbi:MAG: hypothetical protein MUO33_05445 [Sedimentisphaerales bacterium]|nr:hypothetical protein [Sedimentisphaerales bacterium]
MIHYTLTLINKDRNLDLTQKCLDIEQVFRDIDNGGVTGHSFKDLDRYEALQIRKEHIEVDVQESGTSWHRWVGRILANEHGMREYCHGENKDRMFQWN